MYAAHRQYQALSIASRIESASPHELVTILYEELLRALEVTRAALAQGRSDAARSARERSASILVALDASLDLERGGEPARSLAQIYCSMQKELTRAVQDSDAARLEALRQGVADLHSAWVQIGTRKAA
ncbi:MAG TPA: flagellar export chaperone FliS [Sphingomicrobium sp.]|jgi:flagellar protein FliS|nr:flagellar export chaperone FliS [Sphingomicrobium sp.]